MVGAVESGGLTSLTLAEASAALSKGAVSARDLVAAHLDAIAAYDGRINAFITVHSEAALAAAEAADDVRSAGVPIGPLHGLPIAVKDIFDVAGTPTTCHSGAGGDRMAIRDAAVIARLRAAGAIVIGKTALHEFATGGPSFDLPWPPASNPWNLAHHPGGSSSGSGAAVAAGFALAALGTDTAGSVRHPASACGIVGLKPTYDAIERDGVFPLAPTLDHVGLLARSATDIAILYSALRRPGAPFDLAEAVADSPLAGRRIGVIEAFAEGADLQTQAGFIDALDRLRQAGAQIVPLELPPLEVFAACGRLILQAEAYAIHKPWIDARPQDYGKRGMQRILAGRSVDAASYINAQRLRRRLADQVEAALSTVDAALCTSSLFQPCRIDDAKAVDATYDRQARTPFNLSGHPAVAMPTGVSPSGLPLGLQLVGRHWSETALLALAAAAEATFGPMPRVPLSR